MKLNIDLNPLWQNVSKMKAEPVSVDLDINWGVSDLSFDDELSRGIEINIGDLEEKQGLLSVRGRQVLLYIPDHGLKIERAIDDPNARNKFHVADCQTLNRMRRENRFDRYKVTNGFTKTFKVHGIDELHRPLENEFELACCKNCLSKLNYKGYKNLNKRDQDRLARNLDLGEFFSTYSSLFRSYPKQFIEKARQGYTADWPQISESVRKKADYQCRECRVRLNADKWLLHVHHMNRQKDDNRDANLLPLCADCHRKQPYHEHMYVKHVDIQRINHLRRVQGLIDYQDWGKVMQLADPAVYGLLDLCKSKRMSTPEIGYELTNDKDEVVAELELAWPEKKVGVYIGDIEPCKSWTLLDINSAIEYCGKL